MFFDIRGFLIGWAVIAIFLGAHFFFSNGWNSFLFNSALASVVDCVDTETPTTCATSAAKKMLDVKSGAEVMEGVLTRVGPLQCHYISHVVGQQLFHKMHGDIEAAISSCSRVCDSGCVHGIIGESFLTEVGYDDSSLDLGHLSPDDIWNIGRRLCTAPQACHGVGHALFQTYQEFEPALTMCRAVAGEQSANFCYQGVFMEYADIISSKGMRLDTNIELPSQEALGSVCTQSTAEERRACFRYFPRIFVARLDREGTSLEEAVYQLQEVCSTLSDGTDRFACVAGMGSYFSDMIKTDTQRAVRRCQLFPGASYQAACNFGQISVSTQERQEHVFKYCAALSDLPLQRSCYQALLFIFDRFEMPMEEMTKLCSGSTVCLGEIENRDQSPRMYLEMH